MSMLWSANNGYMATEKLSDELRFAVQPLCRFRQFCDVEDAVGKHEGQLHSWNVYGDTADEATDLDESQPMPETSFPIGTGSVTLTEKGISIPYSGKFDDLSEHNVKDIIHKTLKNNCRRALDRSAHAQFNATLLQVVGGASGAITLTDDGTPSGANGEDLTKAHVKTIAITMQERNIPSFDGEDYMCVARPSTLKPLSDDLESVHQYTDDGWKQITFGEMGRYEGVRFVKDTLMVDEGWAGPSDAAFFFGADTVTEAVAVPEEIRGKIPDDYGRGKGIAWYYIGGFAISHADDTSAETKKQARIVKWAST